jgi:histidinol dehydrogenase
MAPLYLKTGSATTATSSSDSLSHVPSIVKSVIESIRKDGDAAVRSFSEKFDKWSPASFKLSASEIEQIMKALPAQVIADIKEVQRNVRTFAQAQRESLKEFELEIQPGVFLGQKNVPINSVGW